MRGLVSTLLAKLGFGGRTTVADKVPTISAPRKQGGVRPDADAGTIDLATGAIMAQNRCGQDTAIKILKIASSTRNVKLRDIAASVVRSISQDPRVRTHFDA